MKPFRERNPIAVGLASILVLSVLMAFAFSLDRLTFLRGVYIIEADFADAAGLTPENTVRVAGLKVGKVRAVELVDSADGEGQDRVRVIMEITNGTRLGNATRAEIKLQTILGSKFLELQPAGGEPLMAEGSRIGLDRTAIPYELYQVTNRTTDELGALDAQALNDALTQLGTLFEDPDGNFGRLLDGLSRATEALNERDADLEVLLNESDTLVSALAGRSAELGRIVDSGGRLLSALEARRSDVKRFVSGSERVSGELSELLVSTRSQLDPILSDLHRTLLVVADHYADLDTVALSLGPSAKSFAHVFQQGTWGEVFLQSGLIPLPNLPPAPIP